jgi:hypothetical protein
MRSVPVAYRCGGFRSHKTTNLPAQVPYATTGLPTSASITSYLPTKHAGSWSGRYRVRQINGGHPEFVKLFQSVLDSDGVQPVVH